jgi:hypothetical protein
MLVDRFSRRVLARTRLLSRIKRLWRDRAAQKEGRKDDVDGTPSREPTQRQEEHDRINAK